MAVAYLRTLIHLWINEGLRMANFQFLVDNLGGGLSKAYKWWEGGFQKYCYIVTTAVWGINETCPVRVEILFEQKSATFDDICP